MNGKPVGVLTASETLGMQNKKVSKRPNVNGTFRRNDQTIAWGTIIPASSISSAVAC
jgi:hypothetical protein